MDKKFVIPGVLLYDTEVTRFITATDADFTINSKRVLNSGDLTPVQQAAPMTLVTATITTMTVRGVATLPANFKVEVTTSQLIIPAFSVTAVGAGAISQILLAQTITKPDHDVVYPIVWVDSTGPIFGKLEWFAATGNIQISKIDGAAFTVAFGPYFDIIVPF